MWMSRCRDKEKRGWREEMERGRYGDMAGGRQWGLTGRGGSSLHPKCLRRCLWKMLTYWTLQGHMTVTDWGRPSNTCCLLVTTGSVTTAPAPRAVHRVYLTGQITQTECHLSQEDRTDVTGETCSCKWINLHGGPISSHPATPAPSGAAVSEIHSNPWQLRAPRAKVFAAVTATVVSYWNLSTSICQVDR